jgi:hypothetical protein
MIRYFSGFMAFVTTFLSRSQSQKQLEALANSVQSLNQEAQGILTREVLEKIDEAAREIRQGIFSRFRTLLLLLLVGFLVLLFLVIIFGPLVYLLIVDVTSSLLQIGLPLLSAVGGLVFKQFIAPKALGVASGENYLENAADRVKDILQQHNKPQPPFFIFGHNHEPDIVKVVSKYPLIWYVNTGSWLYSQGVIEEWLQQTKYHSFLKIIPGKIGAFPELRFWNATTKSGERIRLRQ